MFLVKKDWLIQAKEKNAWSKSKSLQLQRLAVATKFISRLKIGLG